MTDVEQLLLSICDRVHNQVILTSESIIRLFQADFVAKQQSLCRLAGVPMANNHGILTASIAAHLRFDMLQNVPLIDLVDRKKPLQQHYSPTAEPGTHLIASVGSAVLYYDNGE